MNTVYFKINAGYVDLLLCNWIIVWTFGLVTRSIV
jgi:hypothetical protein